jgi:hypothetical protein
MTKCGLLAPITNYSEAAKRKGISDMASMPRTGLASTVDRAIRSAARVLQSETYKDGVYTEAVNALRDLMSTTTMPPGLERGAALPVPNVLPLLEDFELSLQTTAGGVVPTLHEPAVMPALPEGWQTGDPLPTPDWAKGVARPALPAYLASGADTLVEEDRGTTE